MAMVMMILDELEIGTIIGASVAVIIVISVGVYFLKRS